MLLEGIPNHRRDSKRVAARVVREGLIRVHVPASAAVRGIGVDDDEPVPVRQSRILRSGIVCLRGSTAVVNGHEDGRVCSHIVGDVDVHFYVCGIVAEVLHRRELRALDDGCEGEQKGSKTEKGWELSS